MRRPTPGPDDLRALDPQGTFRERLEADRAAIAQLSETGNLEELERIVHGLAGAAGTFGYSDVGIETLGPSRIIYHYDELTPELVEGLLAA